MEYCSVQSTNEDFDRCLKIVKEEMVTKGGFDLNQKALELLTHDIMETSAMMGGSFEEEHIIGVCQQYIDSNFYPRFKSLHRKELMGPLFKI